MDETSELDLDHQVMENEQAKEGASKGKEKNEDKMEKKEKFVKEEVTT